MINLEEFEGGNELPRKNLFSIDKLGYARGDRPKVRCILCGVAEKNPDVPNLSIAETDLSIVSVNLFPYNPGHLIIFPKRHILRLQEATDEEMMDIHRLSVKAITILTNEWRTEGFNLGYNIGKNSGGSIPHIHQHLLPRFPNEAGFLDVFADTRIVIYEPYKMVEEFKRLWNLAT
ncbi:MAG: HIT domain-containing protein [Leptospiraceae bacterium]|nr:HIT domain-containing protein [Leptospiraceae bacterium]MCP5494866.1 HIT domain-containing protein [Leptospiraceae bacterium]